jgi:hypothetical protein
MGFTDVLIKSERRKAETVALHRELQTLRFPGHGHGHVHGHGHGNFCQCPQNTRLHGLPPDIRLSRLHLELPHMQNVSQKPKNMNKRHKNFYYWSK